MKYFCNFLVVLALLSGCEGDEPFSSDSSADYFPLKTGWYQIYDVEETRYQVGSNPVESKYQLMTKIVDSFPGTEDGYTYVIYRSKRMTEADEWSPVDTWSVRNENNAIVLSEGNTPFVKLRYPLTVGSKWNGNAFNSLGEDEYVLTSMRQPLAVNGTTFENTLTVEQERNDDVIVFRDERTEVYAENVGLIYREIIQLHYCTEDACLGQQKVDEGLEMKITIVDYGNQ